MNSQLANSLSKTVQAIQNNAMRVIYRQAFDTHTETLCSLSGLPRVESRMFELTERYLEAAMSGSNELILDLASDFVAASGKRESRSKTPLCDFKDMLETIVFT